MKSPRSLIYTGVGLLFFVILPCFLIASDHMKKQLSGHDCTVTNISGVAGVQYQAAHHLEKKSKESTAYTREWGQTLIIDYCALC